MYLSSVVKAKGHQAYLYMDNGSKDRLIAYIKDKSPDFIGISLMTGQHLWALRVASLIKARFKKNKLKIIFGGPHPTFMPQIIEYPCVDIVCRGEGEGALVDIMDAFDSGDDFPQKIPNLWVKKDGCVIKNNLRPLAADLDILPFCDREIFYQYSFFRNHSNKGIITGRGCPHACAFCFNEQYRNMYNMPKGYIRKRSVSNVIEEIVLLLKKYNNTRYIRFQDDLFTTNKKWMMQFLEIYRKKIKLPFMCYIRADSTDEEIIEEISLSGCVLVNFGIESGDQRVRNKLLNKKLKNQQIYKTAGLLKKYKIPMFTDNMFFIPGAGYSHAWKTVRINQKIKADHVIANTFQPYPGTALYKSLCEQKVIEKNFFDNIPDIYSYAPMSCQENRIERNIYNFFILFIKYPRLTPLFKKLLNMKPNRLFHLIFKITVGLDHKARYKLSWKQFFNEAVHHYKFK